MSRFDVTVREAAVHDLLRSVVDTARAVFAAQASSILLYDEATDELVFRAVSGQGEEFLVGTRFPAGRGVAGWVLVSGEPMVADDLRQQSLFARDVAESTGYVPNGLMAAPLAYGEQVLGVLEVLDPALPSRAGLTELDLLTLFARQAAAGLVVAGARPPEPGAPSPGGAGLASVDRARARELLTALQELLEAP